MFQRRCAFVMAVGVVACSAGAQPQVLREPVAGTGAWATIADGGFESGTMAGWTDFTPSKGVMRATDADAFAGIFSAVTVTAAPGTGPGYAAVSAPIAVIPGERYVLSGAMRFDGLAAGAMYIDMNDIAGEVNLSACAQVDGWQFAWARWTADRASINIRIVRDSTRDPSDAGYFDEIALTPEDEFIPPESTYACAADCDTKGCPGVLDVFDFLCFQQAFATGDPYADCDRTGTLDFFDFICYQSVFAAGCP